jgi:hypothetical protein
MPHAVIRGKNGRRHEVDFGDAPIRVEIYASDETVEILVEADFETHTEERRRFAILNIPRNLFSDASGAAVRRSSTSSLKNRMDRQWRLGSSAQQVSDGASRDATTAPRLVLHRSGRSVQCTKGKKRLRANFFAFRAGGGSLEKDGQRTSR